MANHTPTINYDLKVPVVDISEKTLIIQLGKVGSETTLGELKAILEADSNINSVTLSNADKYTKLIADGSVPSYAKATKKLVIAGEELTLQLADTNLLIDHTPDVKYELESGATPIATVVNNELT